MASTMKREVNIRHRLAALMLFVPGRDLDDTFHAVLDELELLRQKLDDAEGTLLSIKQWAEGSYKPER